MFLREGSQLRGAIVASCVAVTLLTGSIALADTSQSKVAPTRASELSLPYEVLPWRRDVEQRATRELSKARRILWLGRMIEGDAALSDLITSYPNTHAGREARELLAHVRAQRGLSKERRGLGIHPDVASGRDIAPGQSIDPVAGWKTIVRPDPGDLRLALIETAGDRVFFANGSKVLTKEAKRVLKQQARWLRSQPGVDVRIEGHASDAGTREDNMRLSHDRAVIVRRVLIGFGVAARRLNVFAHGMAKPVAICTISTCGAQNRRVVTEIQAIRHAAAPQ